MERNDLDKKGNEVDLIEFFNLIWIGLKKLIFTISRSILFLLVFGLRKSLWLLLFALIGIGIGYVSFSATNQFFRSSMIVQPNGFTSTDMVSYINDIHEFCKEDNKTGLGKAFEIIPENAEKIKDIQAFFFIDVNGDKIGDFVDYKNTYVARDTSQHIIADRLLIQADVFDDQIFSDVRSGLLNYLNKNPYLSVVNRIRKEELQILIEQIDYEITKLDSLQNFEYFSERGSNGSATGSGQLVILNEKQTQLYYHDKQSLLLRQNDYRRTMELSTDPVTIIKDFPALVIVENSAIKYIVIAALITMLIGYLMLLILAYRKRTGDLLEFFRL